MLKTNLARCVLIKASIDIAIAGMCWFAVYPLRFYTGLFATPKGISDFSWHMRLFIPAVGLSLIACVWMGRYRLNTFEWFTIVTNAFKSCILSMLLFFALLYYVNQIPYSRVLLFMYAMMLFPGLIFSSWISSKLLLFWGKPVKYIIIGTDLRAKQLVEDIKKERFLWLECAFFVSETSGFEEKSINGIPVHSIEDIVEDVENLEISEVYYVPVIESPGRTYAVLEKLQNLGVNIRIMPNWGSLLRFRDTHFVSIGSQCLFSASDSRLSGFNIHLKTAFDSVIATILLLVLGIPMLIIAGLIKVTSKGPVFYRQTRVGLNQKRFKIYKFRTMKIDQDSHSSLRWTTKDDDRCTCIGKWLRKSSIDELPQLFNVLKGDMSLVGPRPERPHFVGQFSKEYRRYMCRHKVKAGMTGWAQIHGYRGDTSLKKRLVYDLYYVKNWSIWLDLWILIMTPFHILKGENAY